MTIEIADKWFETRKINDDITLLWEVYVDPLLRCNIWHVRGDEQDMMVDTGLGLGSLHDATRHLIDKPVEVVASHTHLDHVGGHHEFEKCTVHSLEADLLRKPEEASIHGRDWKEFLEGAGYKVEDRVLLDKLPYEGYNPDHYCVQPKEPTRIVDEGDIIDLGNRQFEVLHFPGHSPGSIGLWEKGTGTLFSGDTIYDGPLLDGGSDADVENYIKTMHRLKELPVEIVHAGHDPSFGRARLIELCDAYLKSKDA